MLVTACACATSAPTRPRTCGSGRADGRPRPQRRRQDEPARGALLRLHRRARAGPPTSARWSASAPSVARVEVDARGRRTARTRSAVGFEPGEREAPAGRRRARRAAARRAPPARSSRLPARPARARQGRAGAAPRAPRPGRRRAVAGARARTRRAYGRALAQRNALLGASAPGAPARRRCAPGTPSSPATASR